MHFVGRTHIIRDSSANPLDDFRAINMGGILNLAHQSALTGVTRFDSSEYLTPMGSFLSISSLERTKLSFSSPAVTSL